MKRKLFNKNYDIVKQHDRLEMIEVAGASLGSLSLGAAGVVAFTELINDQPEQYLVAGSLAAIAVTGLTLATQASMKLPILNAMLKTDARTEQLNSTNQTN